MIKEKKTKNLWNPREEVTRMMNKIAFNLLWYITWTQIEQDGNREVSLLILSSQILSFNKMSSVSCINAFQLHEIYKEQTNQKDTGYWQVSELMKNTLAIKCGANYISISKLFLQRAKRASENIYSSNRSMKCTSHCGTWEQSICQETHCLHYWQCLNDWVNFLWFQI